MDPTPSRARAALTVTCAVLVLLVILATLAISCSGGASARQTFAPAPRASAQPCSARGVHAALSRLYSTADVDPLLTGQLYADHTRNVYAQRTSHGDIAGLVEYSSAGGPGDVGVDVGPYGLAEYEGRTLGHDDGIPEAWRLPSTPVRWYAPRQRDHFGPEGPTVYAEGLYSLTEPDHDPLMN